MNNFLNEYSTLAFHHMYDSTFATILIFVMFLVPIMCIGVQIGVVAKSATITIGLPIAILLIACITFIINLTGPQNSDDVRTSTSSIVVQQKMGLKNINIVVTPTNKKSDQIIKLASSGQNSYSSLVLTRNKVTINNKDGRYLNALLKKAAYKPIEMSSNWQGYWIKYKKNGKLYKSSIKTLNTQNVKITTKVVMGK